MEQRERSLMLINYEVDIIIVTPLSTRIHSTVHRLRNGQGATLNVTALEQSF